MFDGKTGTSTKEIPFEAVEVFIDKEEQMCDATSDTYFTVDETGLYNRNDLYIRMDVKELQDSVLLQLIHNWAPPDSMVNPPDGLRLSDYRYWTFRGIVDENFRAETYFIYNNGNYLDNTLILEPTDSTVLMYRRDAGEEWQQLETTRIGYYNYGLLVVDNLKMGDYTLAVQDTQVGEEELEQPADLLFNVFPNPAVEMVNVEYFLPSGGVLKISDNTGRTVLSAELNSDEYKISLPVNGLSPGTYFVNLFDFSNQNLSGKKLIIK
jgi:hypothetical protein